MVRSPLLERFDDRSAAAAALPPSDDWRDGHAAGLAEAAATAALQTGVLRDSLAQTMADITFHFAEARAHLLSSLAPLFSAIADQVLPDLTTSLLRSRVLATLHDAAARDIGRPVHLCLSPDDLGPVQAALDGMRLPMVRLTADAGLAPGQACLMSGPAETVLDVPALISALRDALLNLAPDSDRRSHHG